MSHVERSVTIEAPPGVVWATISRLEDIATWNPNVVGASCGPQRSGVGATRTCHLAPTGRIDEVVTGWIENEEIWFAVADHGAIRSADMGIVLASDPPSGTVVTAVADYHLAFGPLGPVIDHLTVRRMMARMLGAGLVGLKDHIEAAPTAYPPPTAAERRRRATEPTDPEPNREEST